jgi:hypothetical protein
MDTIPQEVVDQIWDEAVSIPPERAEEEFQGVLDSQPALVAYLLALEEDLLPPDDQGQLMMIGFCILRVMQSSGRPLREIEPEEIEEAESVNFAMLEKLNEGVECDMMEAVGKLMSSYPQGPLLSVVLEALMESPEDEDGEGDPESAPENLGLLFIHLKSVIDCLDRN